ncbi:MAG: tetratricopeptide repeat protein [Dokdonella sp.]|nr:MAG: tetratricopeptide repeat protein [Dokdonella sp.]
MVDPRLEPLLALHRAGRLGEAEAGYRQCLAEGIDATLPLSGLLLQQGRHAEAAGLLEPVFAAGTHSPDMAVNLSIALRKLGRDADAVRVARQASTSAPERPAVWNALGLAALEAGDAQTALAAFGEGLRLVPGNAALALHRAKALRRLGRHAEAVPLLEQLVATVPDLLEAWRDLTTARSAVGQHAAALDSATRALQLDPHDPDVALEHASALMHAGRTSEAIRQLERLEGKAQTWMWLAQARLRDNDVAGARAAYARAAERDPDNPFVKHFLAAIDGDLPTEVEADYIRKLFDDFAPRFESILVDGLAYGTPKLLAQFLAANGVTGAKQVLDLGCGTGLMGVELAAPGRTIDGLDLSERMLAQARAKGIYRELHSAELLQFLRDTPRCWDLVLAVDVFVYVAHLAPVFAAVHQRLEVGGHFAFSIECSDGADTQLLPRTGRYRHAPEQLARLLADAGFTAIRREPVTVRFEVGEPVAGELLLARRG